MIQEPAKSIDPRSVAPGGVGTPMLVVVGFVLATAFFVAEHDWRVSLQEHFTVATADAHLHVAGGSLMRRLAFPSIGLLGLCGLLRRKGGSLSLQGPLAVLLTFFFAWCAVSVLWSAHPGLTVRRLIVLGCCLLGALGIARQIGPRGLCVLALGVTTAYVGLGILAEISLGTFRPWSGGYRFGGTLHPNAQGFCCGAMTLAAACLASHAKRYRVLFVGLAVGGMILLVLTKSRTSLGSVLAGLFVLWALRGAWHGKVVAALGAAWMVCIIALTATLGGLDLAGSAGDAALMGRHDSTGSLNGRTPLWAELWDYAGERPLLGYGYDGFWDAGRVQDVSSYQKWTINSAHCAYLDMLLALGIIGASAMVLTIGVTLVVGMRRYQTTGDVGIAFTVCLLTFGTISGLLESPFFLPTSFEQLILIGGVMHLAFFSADRVSRREGAPAVRSQGVAAWQEPDLSLLRLKTPEHGPRSH